MSVDGGKVTLRFEVDLSAFTGGVDTVVNKLKEIDPAAKLAGGAIEKTGTSAITAAVKFQTLAQGGLNLVTSFTQAYTSASNLQRVQTSLAASAVSLERAEDQLARKRFKLNQELEKSNTNYAKVELLTNEIATAEEDLIVKTQALKDAQDRVNDTYVLFALNLTNVAFSGVITAKMMIDLARTTTGVTAATGALTTAQNLNTVATLKSTVAFLTNPLFAIPTAIAIAGAVALVAKK